MEASSSSPEGPRTVFPFGKNWRSFLSRLDDGRIDESMVAIRDSLRLESMAGLRVLDIGSGSGLSSLAMHRLGADVTSFDYDDESVACTQELRERFAPGDARWRVMQGSVLDADFMRALGRFDLVYAWGVLHHTGRMWQAVEHAAACVAPGGRLLLALYNDQGWRSRAWWWIKRTYCAGLPGRLLVGGVFYPLFTLYALGLDLRNRQWPGMHARTYRRNRGMSLRHDWRDWLGGFPFEVTRADELSPRLAFAGFELERARTTRGWGCSEFVYRLAERHQGQ